MNGLDSSMMIFVDFRYITVNVNQFFNIKHDFNMWNSFKF
jgi:hypothetical protein